MKLSEFLNKVNGKEEHLRTLQGRDAMKAVERNGYALRYVKEQTPEVCMKAVEGNGDALQYVNKNIFEPDGNTKKTQPCAHCNGTGIVEV